MSMGWARCVSMWACSCAACLLASAVAVDERHVLSVDSLGKLIPLAPDTSAIPAGLVGEEAAPQGRLWVRQEEKPVRKRNTTVLQQSIVDGNGTGDSVANDTADGAANDAASTCASSAHWHLLSAVVFFMVLLDLLVLQKHTQKFRSQLMLIVFWVYIGLMFDVVLWYSCGRDKGMQWLAGYYLEWALSMDNLLVYNLIFTAYRLPPHLLHKALFYGILFSLIMRLSLFLILGPAQLALRWLRLALGLVLMHSGAMALWGDGEIEDVGTSWVFRLTRSFMGSRLLDEYDEGIIVEYQGRFCFTLLMHVIICMEATDVVFALDSVTAKIATIPDSFVAYSSTVMATFSLRAAFFILHRIIGYVQVMRYGVCFSLTFIGVELVLSSVAASLGLHWYYMPEGLEVAVVGSVFSACGFVATIRWLISASKG